MNQGLRFLTKSFFYARGTLAGHFKIKSHNKPQYNRPIFYLKKRLTRTSQNS
jgi:hypothetical protein